LDEIFNNAVIHSKSEHGIYCCGQAYPRTNKIKFTISDCGIGIRRSILENRGLVKTGEDAINWAMTEGTTTRIGDVPGGLGLKILREFIEINQGEIQIVSENGYWALCNGNVTTSPLFRAYPGTVVSIQINTADDNLYYLAEEIDPNKVF
jgi:signal transduction histidine kinase